MTCGPLFPGTYYYDGLCRNVVTSVTNTDGYLTISPTVGDVIVNLDVSALNGALDHGSLAGLADDDHTQYLNETRHDALAADNPHSVSWSQSLFIDATSGANNPSVDAGQTFSSNSYLSTTDSTDLFHYENPGDWTDDHWESDSQFHFKSIGNATDPGIIFGDVSSIPSDANSAAFVFANSTDFNLVGRPLTGFVGNYSDENQDGVLAEFVLNLNNSGNPEIFNLLKGLNFTFNDGATASTNNQFEALKVTFVPPSTNTAASKYYTSFLNTWADLPSGWTGGNLYQKSLFIGAGSSASTATRDDIRFGTVIGTTQSADPLSDTISVTRFVGSVNDRYGHRRSNIQVQQGSTSGGDWTWHDNSYGNISFFNVSGSGTNTFEHIVHDAGTVGYAVLTGTNTFRYKFIQHATVGTTTDVGGTNTYDFYFIDSDFPYRSHMEGSLYIGGETGFTDTIGETDNLGVVGFINAQSYIRSDVGFRAGDGTDQDYTLIDVDVTGDPQLLWDESADSFVFNKTLTIGIGAAGIDYQLLFDGETNNGSITWKEDEDYFSFDDNVFIANELLFEEEAKGNQSGSVTIDWTASQKKTMTLTGNVTSVAMTEPSSNAGVLRLWVVQDGTGGRTITGWDSKIKWAGGVTPGIATGASERTVYWFEYSASKDEYVGGVVLDAG